MALSKTTVVSCDHTRKDGTRCTMRDTIDQIRPEQPYYHISVVVEAVTSEGTREIHNQDDWACRWDTFDELDKAWQAVKADLEARNERLRLAQEEAAELERALDTPDAGRRGDAD